MKTRIIKLTIETPDDYIIEESNWTLEDIVNHINGVELKDFHIEK